MCGKRDESIVLDDMVTALERLTQLGPRLPDHHEPERELVEMTLWNLTLLGEASKRLRTSTTARFPEVAWSDMAKTRDRVVHDYDGIDWFVVRRICTDFAPSLLPRLIEIRDILRAEADEFAKGAGTPAGSRSPSPSRGRPVGGRAQSRRKGRSSTGPSEYV